ncbi:hypothetical protein PR003_g23011, partial [Phytophthora rubi]
MGPRKARLVGLDTGGSLPLLQHSLAESAAPYLGVAYGTAKTGVGIASMGVMRPDLAMRNIIPVVMAGVLGIYALIV